jgi:phosphoglycolate phosphatase-like HAD superfamily hydrolase
VDAPYRLVLWDIDHTLIASGGVGYEIAAEAFATVTGVTMRTQAEVSGSTEPIIFHETLKLHDLDPDAFAFPKYAAALADGYARHADRLRQRGRVLAGAADTIGALAAEPGVTQTVVTGNTRAVARIKLTVFGLATHIVAESGAYGDDHEDRAHLVALAIGRARERTGHAFTASETVLIGDTIADVRAGSANHVRTIGVATGSHPAQALRDAGAAAVLASLTDTAAVARLVLGF